MTITTTVLLLHKITSTFTTTLTPTRTPLHILDHTHPLEGLEAHPRPPSRSFYHCTETHGRSFGLSRHCEARGTPVKSATPARCEGTPTTLNGHGHTDTRAPGLQAPRLYSRSLLSPLTCLMREQVKGVPRPV